MCGERYDWIGMKYANIYLCGKYFLTARRRSAMQLSSIFMPTQISQVPTNKHPQTKPTTQVKSSCIDTVYISEEALAAYQKSRTSISNVQQNKYTDVVFSNTMDKEIEERLSKFFNSTHSSSNIVMSGDIILNSGNGELLPENKQLKEQLEREIDKIQQDENYAPPAVASPEYLAKIDPLRQKLNAIAALGDTMIMTNDVLESSATYLQKLEDEWSEGKNLDMSIEGRFRTAINGEANILNTHFSEEEKTRMIKEEAIGKKTSY